MQRNVQVRRAKPGLVAASALLFVVLAACTTTGDPEAIADPRRDDPTVSTAAGSEPETESDEVVWQEFTTGGFAPPAVVGRAVPAVTIYRDGRIFTTVEGTEGPPVELEQARIPADDLDAFLAAAEESGLVDPATDFGSPGVTDQPSTMVLLKTGDTPQHVDVYALGFDDGQPTVGVDAEQAERRTRLLALIARARELGEGATPYVPDRVTASRVDPSVVIDPPTASPTWPGPPLSVFPPIDELTGSSCLVIEGEDARTVYQADRDNPETTWEVDGDVQAILIVPLLPGQEGCPPT